MNSFSFSVFNIFSMFAIFLFVIFAVCPFDIIDMEQAERIAKWKSKYEQLNYCFALTDMHEGIIAPNFNFDEDTANKLFISHIKPYFNLSNDNLIRYEKYKYKRKNGSIINKNSQFYFDKFIKYKDGSLINFIQKK